VNANAGPSSRKRQFTSIAMLFSILAGLGLAEAGLRIAGWPAPGFYVDGRGPLELRASGRSGGAYPPNTFGELRHYDFNVKWRVNSYGFRDRSVKPKLPGEWRIGLLGDSFAAGFGVKEDERFSDIWFGKIKEHLPNVTLWNLASPVCGTACEAEILEGVGRGFDLDEIVLAFFGGNDIDDNIKWHREMGNSTDPRVKTSLETIRAWLREHCRVATFFWVTAVHRFIVSFRRPILYSETEIKQAWQDTERSLDRFKTAVGPRHWTVLYLPAMHEWDDSVWRELSLRVSPAGRSRFAVKSALLDWAARNDVRVIDATLWLNNCPSITDCSFRNDVHWNARAHFLVGTGLALHWIGGLRTRSDKSYTN
jgi:hypothetical protein